jgi:hypothetical protein
MPEGRSNSLLFMRLCLDQARIIKHIAHRKKVTKELPNGVIMLAEQVDGKRERERTASRQMDDKSCRSMAFSSEDSKSHDCEKKETFGADPVWTAPAAAATGLTAYESVCIIDAYDAL